MTHLLPHGRGRLTIVEDGEALARAAAARFVELTRAAVDERGRALVALSGGSTPRRMGELLASAEFAPYVPWDRTDIFWGDERWTPLGDRESNAGNALRGWLEQVSSPERVHPVDTTLATPADAAAAYEAAIRAAAGGGPDAPVFDLILLGMGDDGHTASLFPGTAALAIRDRLVAENFVPKLDAHRVTFTYPLIDAAREVLVLVGGAGKAETLAAVLEGPDAPDHYPSQAVRPASGARWLADEAAAARLAAGR
ncbi:MAG: 6-phosphogluconolactonase [Chloroflexota bacterium]